MWLCAHYYCVVNNLILDSAETSRLDKWRLISVCGPSFGIELHWWLWIPPEFNWLCLKHFLTLKKSETQYQDWQYLILTLQAFSDVAEHFPTDFSNFGKLWALSAKSCVVHLIFWGYYSTITFFPFLETIFVYIPVWQI